MSKRIVVKVGSNVLTRDDGKTDITRVSAIVDQVAWLRDNGHEVILVSSGSVSSGRSELHISHKLDSVSQRQLFSAVGQVKLINLYYDFFREKNIVVGQILTMKESFATRREYLNQRSCMEVMLANGVIPIINENDTISITELMFTDNDELSGLIASMMDADMLIILSNVDGLYNGKPGAKGTHLVSQVAPGDDVSTYIQEEKSGFGRGGMRTKCAIAHKAADEGIRVVIANGRRENIIPDIMTGKEGTPFTEFVPSASAMSSVKKWIAHSEGFAKGTLTINERAADILRKGHAVSLLMVGVTAVDGDFDEGDIVSIVDNSGVAIAIGRSSYNSDDAHAFIGKHDVKPIVHCDYMYMLNED